jgi:hypothetical protein
MTLTKEELNRKEELFKKYRRYNYLTFDEIKELANLIKKDDSIPDNVKPMLLLGLRQFAIYVGYELSESDYLIFES